MNYKRGLSQSAAARKTHALRVEDNSRSIERDALVVVVRSCARRQDRVARTNRRGFSSRRFDHEHGNFFRQATFDCGQRGCPVYPRAGLGGALNSFPSL